jgi:hypothetical protein
MGDFRRPTKMLDTTDWINTTKCVFCQLINFDNEFKTCDPSQLI